MKRVRKIVGIVALLASLPAHAAGNWFANPRLPAEVQAAHDAYLRGDFDHMVLSIKEALMAYPGDNAIESDVLDLYDKAYEMKGYEALTPDWKAPAALSWLSVTAKKKHSLARNVIEYRMQFNAEYPIGQDLEQIQLIRYPNEVLLDRQAGLGELVVKPLKGNTDFWMAANYHRSPNAPGLYLLLLKMRGADPIQGWFILGKDANATGSPEVSLKPDQVIVGGQPTFAWKEFLSAEYKPFERRKIIISVVRRADDVMDNTWLTLLDPPATSATVGGLQGEPQGVSALPPDSYTIQVAYRERRKFGDVRIGRDSGTVVPFSVRLTP